MTALQTNYSASYILQDGSILRVQDYGFRTHYEYENNYAKENHLQGISYPKRYLINLNQWIRLNDGTNMKFERIVELPIKPITEEQYKSLLEFLDYMWFNNKEYVDIGIEEHSVGTKFSKNAIFFKHYDFNEYTSDDIIKEIRQLYNKLKIK